MSSAVRPPFSNPAILMVFTFPGSAVVKRTSTGTPGAGTAATALQLDAHRAALTGHCYRMLGSLAEADDAVQETMLRAWRSLEGFDGRSSLRTWLYRIATHVCLDALSRITDRYAPPPGIRVVPINLATGELVPLD